MERKTFCLSLIFTQIILFVSTIIISIYFDFYNKQNVITWLVLFFGLTAIIGLFISLFSFKRSLIISSILLLISLASLFIFYQFFASTGRPSPNGPSRIIKANLASIRAYGSIFYNENNRASYEGLCEDVNIVKNLQAAEKIGKEKVKCFSDKDSFVAVSILAEKDYFCVDSNNYANVIDKNKNNQIINSDILCK